MSRIKCCLRIIQEPGSLRKLSIYTSRSELVVLKTTKFVIHFNIASHNCGDIKYFKGKNLSNWADDDDGFTSDCHAI